MTWGIMSNGLCLTANILESLNQGEGFSLSDNQLSYITNVDSGRGLIKCGSAIVPFVDSFPRHTRLYQMMTTRPSDLIA